MQHPEKSIIHPDLTTDPSFEDVMKREISTFDIKSVVEILDDEIAMQNRLMSDFNEPLYHGSIVRKETFCHAIDHWLDESNVTVEQRHKLINILHNGIGPICNLPTKELPKNEPSGSTNNSVSSDGYENYETDNDSEVRSLQTEDLNICNVQSTLKDYCKETTRFVTLDQCIKNCTVFIGDNADLLKCPNCQSSRFRPCTRAKCSRRGFDDCKHLATTDGIAFKRLYYRSLIIMIKDLVKLPSFIPLLNYSRKHTAADSVNDFMDGQVAKSHLSEMNQRFMIWKSNDVANRENATPVNLLLSEFYDSGQLFHRKATDFWPLCVGIMNLPPTHRGKVGIGYFIQALYLGNHHGNVERILFSDLFCEELRCLYIGVEFAFEGMVFFIQARLVLHILDGRAAEGLFHFQSTSNSNVGCPLCLGVTGIHDGAKCNYFGHRNYLPEMHYLRMFGQTGKCCQYGYHDPEMKNTWFLSEEYDNMHRRDNQFQPFFIEEYKIVEDILKEDTEASRRNLAQRNEELIDLFCLPCDGNRARRDRLVDFLFIDSTLRDYDWHHSGHFALDMIRKNPNRETMSSYFFARHFDLREPKPYSRVSYHQYLTDALRARELNRGRKSKAKKQVKGLQDVWSFARLQYADMEKQYTWPFAHVVCGIIHLLFDCMTGRFHEKNPNRAQRDPNKAKNRAQIDIKKREKGKKIKKRKFRGTDDSEESQTEDCDGDDELPQSLKQQPNFRPSYFRTDESSAFAPYCASGSEVEKASDWLNCILLPRGISDDAWKVSINRSSEYLGSIGTLKMTQKLKLLSCYWGVMLYVMESIKDGFKQFFSLIAFDLGRLLSFNFPTNEMDNLTQCIIETVAVWELIMPTITNNIQVHELVDLAPFIPLFGPPMGVSEFPGERMIGMMKNHKKKANTGGISFGKEVMRKQVSLERRRMKQAYSMPVDKIHEVNNKLSFNKSTQIIEYNEFPFYLYEVERKISRLTDFEIGFLSETLISQITRLFPNQVSREENSPLYRLWMASLPHDNKAPRIPPSQTTFVMKLKYVLDHKEKFDQQELYVANNLIQFQPQFFRKACIYGLQFPSRGYIYREMEQWSYRSANTRYGADELTSKQLRDNQWSYSNDFSSWCKYDKNINNNKENYYFGQLNMFFSAESIGDPCLSRLLLASITSYKSSNISRVPGARVDCIKMSGSLDARTLFIALQDVCPTRVATIPISDDGKAITLKATQVRTPNVTTEKKAKHLLMIILHPEKLSLQPSNRPHHVFM